MRSRKNKVLVSIIIFKALKIVLIINPPTQTEPFQNRQALFKMISINIKGV